MIDNFNFLSARAGESLSEFSVTADSDTQFNFANKRVMRIDSPHWLPPVEVADLYRVKEWNLNVVFTTPDTFNDGLEGDFNYPFKAGKWTGIIEYPDGEAITGGSGHPGWSSVVDSISAKPYFDPVDEVYRDGNVIGGLLLFRYVTTTIDGADQSFSLRVTCEISKPRPMIYVLDDVITDVWIVDATFLGQARSWSFYDPEPSQPTIETNVGLFTPFSGGPRQIGTVDDENPTNDTSIKLTLSALSYHDDFG